MNNADDGPVAAAPIALHSLVGVADPQASGLLGAAPRLVQIVRVLARHQCLALLSHSSACGW